MKVIIIKPQKLQKGDTIGIIAPSCPIMDCGNEAIDRGYKYLQNKGFKVKEASHCRKVTGHTAGSIKDRINAIHKFFKDDSVKAIMAFWGGANSNQLLEYLDFKLISQNPKIFIGFSDISALLLAITKKSKLITFMGPGVISFVKPEPFDYTWEYFEKICINPKKEVTAKDSKYFADDAYYLRKDSNHRILQKNKGLKIFKKGKAEGEIIATNLQTLLVLIGTKFFPNLSGKILFLEEDESQNTSMINRFLTQSRQAKILSKVKGIVFGRFVSQSGFCRKDPLEEVLKDIFKGINIPIMYNSDFGHSDPLFTIPNGGRCRINTIKKEIVFYQSVE